MTERLHHEVGREAEAERRDVDGDEEAGVRRAGVRGTRRVVAVGRLPAVGTVRREEGAPARKLPAGPDVVIAAFDSGDVTSFMNPRDSATRAASNPIRVELTAMSRMP